MRNKYFNTVVEKMSKYKWKVLDTKKMKDIIWNIMWDEYETRKFYKIIYYLTNRWYIVPMKKKIYYINPSKEDVDEKNIANDLYRDILKKFCNRKTETWKWYIWWMKALELHINNLSIPEDIVIISKYKQWYDVLMFDKHVIFKNYVSKDEFLFDIFFKYTSKIYIDNIVFNYVCIEIALLESLYNISKINEIYIIELVKKIIRQNADTLNIDIWKNVLIHNKHHSSINRLYRIAEWIDPVLADKIKSIIKKYSYVI